MGSGAQQQTGSQVFYDPVKGQYYTMKNPNANRQSDSPVFQKLFGEGSPFYQANAARRNYLGMPNGSMNNGGFTPNYIQPNYPDIGELFPMLDAGLAQNLQQSLLAPTDTQSSGAARFLAPSNTSKGK